MNQTRDEKATNKQYLPIEMHSIPRSGLFAIWRDLWWLVDASGRPQVLFNQQHGYSHPQCSEKPLIAYRLIPQSPEHAGKFTVRQLPLVLCPVYAYDFDYDMQPGDKEIGLSKAKKEQIAHYNTVLAELLEERSDGTCGLDDVFALDPQLAARATSVLSRLFKEKADGCDAVVEGESQNSA